MVCAQSGAYISGPGTTAGSYVNPNTECTYTIKYNSGSMPSNYKSMVNWRVDDNGTIKSKDGSVPSATIVWNSGATRGYVYADNVYDNGKFVTINYPIDINPSMSDITLDFSLSKNVVSNYENFDVIISSNADNQYGTHCSGNDLSIETVNGDNRHYRGYFTSTGLKTIFVSVGLVGGIQATRTVSKEIMVLPNLYGQDLLKWNETQTYTVGSLPPGVTVDRWEVSDWVIINSGQGTNSIIVKHNTAKNVQNLMEVPTAMITAYLKYKGQEYTLTKRITVFIPVLGSISGPVRASVGQKCVYSVTPGYPTNGSLYRYEWTVNSQGAVLDLSSSYSVGCTFYSPGSYRINCSLAVWNGTAFVYPSTFLATIVEVERYRITSGSSGQISIKDLSIDLADGISTFSLNNSSLVNYEIYSSAGFLVAKGKYDTYTGILDLSRLSKGNYILKIQAEGNIYESHRILIR